MKPGTEWNVLNRQRGSRKLTKRSCCNRYEKDYLCFTELLHRAKKAERDHSRTFETMKESAELLELGPQRLQSSKESNAVERKQSLKECTRELLFYQPTTAALRSEDKGWITQKWEKYVKISVCSRPVSTTFQHLKFTPPSTRLSCADQRSTECSFPNEESKSFRQRRH